MVERIIREIRRSSRGIGGFPSRESYVRLITCYLIEYTEDWIKDRSYIKLDKIAAMLDERAHLMEAQVSC